MFSHFSPFSLKRLLPASAQKKEKKEKKTSSGRWMATPARQAFYIHTPAAFT